MIEAFNEYKVTILGVQEVARDQVNKYGIIDAIPVAERICKVKSLVEKPDIGLAPSNMAILGRGSSTKEVTAYLENLFINREGVLTFD